MKLIKQKYNLTVTIPQDIVKQQGLEKGDEMTITTKGKKIILEKAEKEKG